VGLYSPKKSMTTNNKLTFALLLALVALFSLRTTAQEPISNKDLEQLIKSLYSDAKTFRSMFDSALDKSEYHKSVQEKDAKLYAEAFQNQTKNMLDNVKKTGKPAPFIDACLDNAAKIDSVFKAMPLDPATTAQWSRTKAQLDSIAKAVQPPAH
jgi:uncharacterized protein with gpF-like domain